MIRKKLRVLEWKRRSNADKINKSRKEEGKRE